MEELPAQQVNIEDEDIQDSTISSNSVLSIEAVYVKEELDDEEFNNNIEVKFDQLGDDAIFDATTRQHIHQNINLRANIQMIRYPDANIRIRHEALQYDDNAMNLVKIRKSDTVVEKSEATSTSNFPGNNQLMHFITAPLQSDDTIPIDMLAFNNFYEQRFDVQDTPAPPVDQDVQQDMERPGPSRQNQDALLSNDRNPIDIGESSNRHHVPDPSRQLDTSDDSDGDIQPPVNPEPRTKNATIDENIQQYVCDICQVLFRKRCCLITHIFNIHNEGPSGSAEKSCYCQIKNEIDRDFECDICHEKFLHKNNLRKHLRLHDDENIFTCHFCFKIFKRNTNFVLHLESHDKRYNCRQCKKKFCDLYNLKSHILHHHNEAPYECNNCPKKFNRYSLLKRHKLTHKKVKRLQCTSCQEVFETKAKLHLHQDMHINDKSFCCATCKMEFKHKSQYLLHLHVHNGDKSYKCQICHKCFAQKSKLNRHLRIHKDAKPHTCEICQKKFRQNNHLISHKNKVHKEKQQDAKKS